MKMHILAFFVVLTTQLFAQPQQIVVPQHSVDLSWDASATSGVTYNVYKGNAPGVCGGTKLTSGLTALSFSDTSVQNGATYFYAYSAQNADGESACTSEVSVVIPQPPQPPQPPTNPKAVVR